MNERETFPSLTGLRFVLAAWITIYHLVSMYGAADLAHHPLLAAGNARVDIFFVLSGFVLAHVYALRGEAGAARFRFGAFLTARVARLYPLHLFALLILGAAVLAAGILGRGEEVKQFTLEGLIANLFMLQATAFPAAAVWNFPAWTLSAEAFGYLLFPAFLAVGAALRGRGLLFWAGALGAVGVVGLFWPLLGGGPLSEATQIWGIVRGALCMSVGVAARYAFEGMRFGRAQALALACAGGLIALAAAVGGFDLWLVAFGGSTLIFGVAALDRSGAVTPLAHPIMVRLGNWSYALFILHVPLFIVLERALKMAGWDGALTVPIGAVFFGIALAVSWPAHAWLEEPARRMIRGLNPKAKPQTDPTAPLGLLKSR